MIIESIINWFVANVNWLVTTYGLFGIFIASIIANATLFFGIPIEIAIIALASTTQLNPILLGLAGGLGAAIGEMVSYLIGYGGNFALKKTKSKKDILNIEQFEKQIENKGFVAVALLCLIPVPFDLVGLAAGLTKMKWWKFFIGAFIGKSIRYTIIGFAGAVGIKLVLSYFGIAV